MLVIDQWLCERPAAADLSDTLRCVLQAERDAGTRQDGGLTTEERKERKELSELRRENRRLREDVEILKRATAFFASMSG